MLQIAVCDDSPEELNKLTALLGEYARLRPQHGFGLSPFPSGSALLEDARIRGGFQIYLLDVMMPGPDGLAVGAAIREHDPDAAIVYLTTSPDYAVDSYSVRASGYLLKPILRDALFAQLDRVLEGFSREASATLAIQARDCVSRLRMADIRYVEGTNHTVNFYLSKERTAAAPKRGSFEDIAAPLLADERFLRVGASYLVNLLYVERLEGGCLVMQEGGSIPIPRLKRTEVRERFLEFTLKRGLAL